MIAKITLEIQIPEKIPLDRLNERAKFELGFSGVMERDNPLYKERLRDKIYGMNVMADDGPTRTSKFITPNENRKAEEIILGVNKELVDKISNICDLVKSICDGLKLNEMKP